MSIRVIIADDHALFRQGLRSLLALHAQIEIVAEVDRVDDLLSVVERVACDVILLDLQMDRWSTEDIASLSSHAKVLVLTASERNEDALAAIQRGARAVVQKRFAVETLLEAIRAVAEGNVWLPTALQAEVAKQWTSTPVALTPREREIVTLVGHGLRNAEIARELFISEATVKTHLNNVFQKLEVRDRVGVARYAIRVGLADPRSER